MIHLALEVNVAAEQLEKDLVVYLLRGVRPPEAVLNALDEVLLYIDQRGLGVFGVDVDLRLGHRVPLRVEPLTELEILGVCTARVGEVQFDVRRIAHSKPGLGQIGRSHHIVVVGVVC